MRRLSILIILLSTVSSLIYAGEVSSFVNLGFSSDSKNFAYGTHALRSDRVPSSTIGIVHLQNNVFIGGTPLSHQGTRPIEPGQDGSGSLFKLLINNATLLQRNGIDTERSGRPIYVLLNGQEQAADLSFRDFQTNTEYTVALTQQKTASGASFGIRFTVSRSGSPTRTLHVGRPHLVRPGIDSYKIRQIILSPDEKSLVFVVERTHSEGQALLTTYMVETITL